MTQASHWKMDLTAALVLVAGVCMIRLGLRYRCA